MVWKHSYGLRLRGDADNPFNVWLAGEVLIRYLQGSYAIRMETKREGRAVELPEFEWSIQKILQIRNRFQGVAALCEEPHQCEVEWVLQQVDLFNGERNQFSDVRMLPYFHVINRKDVYDIGTNLLADHLFAPQVLQRSPEDEAHSLLWSQTGGELKEVRVDEEEIRSNALGLEEIECIEQATANVFNSLFIAAEAVRDAFLPGSGEKRIHGGIERMGDDLLPMLQEFSPGESAEISDEEFLGGRCVDENEVFCIPLAPVFRIRVFDNISVLDDAFQARRLAVHNDILHVHGFSVSNVKSNIQHAGVAGQVNEFLFLANDMHAEPIAENLRLDCLEKLGQVLGIVLEGQELVDPRRQMLPLLLHVLLVGECRTKEPFLMHSISLNDYFDGIT